MDLKASDPNGPLQWMGTGECTRVQPLLWRERERDARRNQYLFLYLSCKRRDGGQVFCGRVYAIWPRHPSFGSIDIKSGSGAVTCYKQMFRCITNHSFAKTPMKSASWHGGFQWANLIVIGCERNGNGKIPLSRPQTCRVDFQPIWDPGSLKAFHR